MLVCFENLKRIVLISEHLFNIVNS